MRKELVWVIIIGITFGLIIAFGAWRINSSFNKPKKIISQETPAPVKVEEEKIVLDKPDNNDVVLVTPITVSGITKPLAWVTISGEDGDYIIQSDESGIFSQQVDLIAGINQIKVTLLGKDGNQTFQKVLVVYSSSFQLTATQAPTPITATEETDIKDAVDQKLTDAMNKPKAYLGVVTDITGSTIQIKTIDEVIAQISVENKNISVVDSKGKTSKNVKLTDIAIGDFIVAMGYIEQKSVLKAQRILITNPVTEPKLDISMSKVVNVSKKYLSISDVKTGSVGTLTPDKNTSLESYSKVKNKVIGLNDFAKNDIVISVSDSSVSPTILRSIFNIGAQL